MITSDLKENLAHILYDKTTSPENKHWEADDLICNMLIRMGDMESAYLFEKIYFGGKCKIPKFNKRLLRMADKIQKEYLGI